MTMNSYPKVLVASPTYDGKDYIFEQHFNVIKNLSYPNYEYIYLDNTRGDSYTKKLRMRGAKVLHVPRGENSRVALTNSQNMAVKIAIDRDCDYLMFIESDLLPNKDIIEQLMKHSKPVVGATYLIGTEGIKYPCIFVEDFNKNTNSRVTRPLLPQEIYEILKHKGLYRVHGVGFGCTLIRIDLLKRFPLWVDERYTDKHSDVYFYLALSRASIPVYVDTSIMVEHHPSSWKKVKDM